MKKLLIFYNYFKPAKNAGGIVRSLDNLVNLLSKDFECFIFTSASDLGLSKPMTGIKCDIWNPYSNNLFVYYATAGRNYFGVIRDQIKNIKPDALYVNGFFTPQFVLIPLMVAKTMKPKPLVVIAPRGMLQQGALIVKGLKKRFYLKAFKILNLENDVRWHATDEQEFRDIQSIFGFKASGFLAMNVPVSVIPNVKIISKTPDELRIVHLSLITEKKNLLFLFKVLKRIPADIKITFDVYGPIKDRVYWSKCLEEVKTLPEHISFSYKGLADPDDVINIFQQYHFFVLPTLGENFGHAIYESLIAGRPVIISDKTPWKKLDSFKAGFDVPLIEESFISCIEHAARMKEDTFNEYCIGAQGVARKYLMDNDFPHQYAKLFSL